MSKNVACIRTRRLLVMQHNGRSSSWRSEGSRGPGSSSLMGERLATPTVVIPIHFGSTWNPKVRSVSEYRPLGLATCCSLVPRIRPMSFWVNLRVYLLSSTLHLYPGCATPLVKYIILPWLSAASGVYFINWNPIRLLTLIAYQTVCLRSCQMNWCHRSPHYTTKATLSAEIPLAA